MTDVFKYDNLFAGNVQPIVSDEGSILAGQNITRGSALGLVTATGKLKLVDSTSTDGSQTIYAIASEDINATNDTKTIVYLTGEFNINALTFGGTDTYLKHKTVARTIGIFLKNIVQ